MTMQDPKDPFEGLGLTLTRIPHPHIYRKVSDERIPIAEYVFRRREWLCRFCETKKVKLTV